MLDALICKKYLTAKQKQEMSNKEEEFDENYYLPMSFNDILELEPSELENQYFEVINLNNITKAY